MRLYRVRTDHWVGRGRPGHAVEWGEDSSDPNPFPQPSTEPLLLSTRGQVRPEGDYFDEGAAQAAVDFFPLMKHTQGPLAGQPFELAPEQEWLVREAFGWYRASGLRRYREVYVEVGRGNGKSQLGAGVGGKLLYADGEASPEVTGAAKDRPQATIVLQRLQAMVRTNPDLVKRSQLLRKSIRNRRNSGEYRAASADVGGAWGGAPHGIVFDEVHTQPNRDLWDALTTGLGKRAQPMVWGLTTAGWDKESLCWEKHELVRQVAEGTIDLPDFLGVVWAAPEDADWTDPAVWQQANPMLSLPGSDRTPSGALAAISYDFMAAECAKALASPPFQNTFRTMYLSQWVGQEVRYLPMEHWDACNEPVRPAKRPAFGGLDLSSTTDLSAFVVVSERDGKVDVDVKMYAPAEGLRERCRRDRVPYDVWAREGLLTLTPGTTIDQDYIKADVLAAKEKYDLVDVGYDRWNAAKIVKELEGEGVTMVQVGQGFASLSAPTKRLLELVLKHAVRHGGNACLRWQASNVAAVVDSAENMKPDKAKSSSRIDGIAATITALDGLTRRGGTVRKQSHWNTPKEPKS